MSNRNYPMGSLSLWLETESEIESISSKARKGVSSHSGKISTAPIPEVPYPEFLIRCKKLSTSGKISLLTRKIRYLRTAIQKEQKHLSDMLKLKQYLKESEK